MNKNQIKKVLCEVENLLQQETKCTVMAFIDSTDNPTVFQIKEIVYHQNGKINERKFEISTDSAYKAADIYNKDYATSISGERFVFIYDFGEEE